MITTILYDISNINFNSNSSKIINSITNNISNLFSCNNFYNNNLINNTNTNSNNNYINDVREIYNNDNNINNHISSEENTISIIFVYKEKKLHMNAKKDDLFDDLIKQLIIRYKSLASLGSIYFKLENNFLNKGSNKKIEEYGIKQNAIIKILTYN